MDSKISLLSLAIVVFLVSVVHADLVHRYSFVSNADDSIGSAHGSLEDDAYVSSNAVQLDGSGDYVNLPGPTIDINTFPAVTLELWSTQPTINQGYSMTAAFGSTWGNGTGRDYINIATARGDNVSRGAIANTPDSDSPWNDEVYVNGPELNDGLEHHYVLTINDTEIAYYIDGDLQGAVPLGGTTISETSNDYAYLGKGVYTGDATMECSINEFRIYNIAFSDSMVEASFTSGPDTPIETYSLPSNPNPPDQNEADSLTPTLTWQSDPSEDITGHRVYLGTNYTAVLTADTNSTGIYQTTKPPGNETFTPTSDLEMEQTYYWRIEEVTASYIFSGPIWSFYTPKPKAGNPIPQDGTGGISVPTIILQWEAAEGAVGHRILFGTSPEALEILEANYSETSYVIESLDYAKDYYWRIDELFSSAPDQEGDVWTFSTIQAPCPCILGDLDRNCTVDFNDLALFTIQWLQDVNCSGCSCPDFDNSDFIDFVDFSILANNWMKSDNE